MQNGASCLSIASQNGHLEVVKHLCERGGEALLMLANSVSEDLRRVVRHVVCFYESSAGICAGMRCTRMIAI